MAQQIEFRRDTAAQWTATNPVLAQGEPGLETDTKKFKIGDGTTAWASLAYVAAQIAADSALTGVFAQRANNLSDLASASSSRTNLGLGTAATLASSAVAQTANNLSDLASAGTARTNLGLGTAAVLASSAVAQTANNLSDLASAATARTNLGLGTAATQATSVFAQTANNLSDLASATTARGNVGAAQDAARTSVKTSNYTASAGDLVPVDTTSGNVTITLPTAPADKSRITVKQVVRGGTNTVTIAAGGSDVFNVASGVTTLILTLSLQAVTLIYTTSGAIWTAISDDLALSQLDARYDAAGAASTAQAASLQKSSNLSDLVSATTARTNLGLAAIAASGSASDLSAGSVPAGRFGATTVPISAINASGSASSSTFLRGDGSWQTSVGANLYLAATYQ